MRHDAYILRKPSAVGFESGGHTHLLVLGTLRKQLALAIKAGAAGDVMKTDRAVSDRPLFYAGSNFHDRPRDLVAENLRRADNSLPNLLYVGAADTAGAYAKENFAGQDFRYWDVFDDNLA